MCYAKILHYAFVSNGVSPFVPLTKWSITKQQDLYQVRQHKEKLKWQRRLQCSLLSPNHRASTRGTKVIQDNRPGEEYGTVFFFCASPLTDSESVRIDVVLRFSR